MCGLRLQLLLRHDRLSSGLNPVGTTGASTLLVERSPLFGSERGRSMLVTAELGASPSCSALSRNWFLASRVQRGLERVQPALEATAPDRDHARIARWYPGRRRNLFCRLALQKMRRLCHSWITF